MRHVLVLVSLLGCASSPPPPSPPTEPPAPATPPAAAAPAAPDAPVVTAAASDAAKGTVIGDPFEPGTPIAAAELVKASDTWNGKEVVVTGTVRSVCQAKGCWHRLATDDAKVDIMVKASRYHIFLPKDAAGRTAIVKGTFTRATMPLEEAKHYAKDAGENPDLVTEAPLTYGVDAAGVILL